MIHMEQSQLLLFWSRCQLIFFGCFWATKIGSIDINAQWNVQCGHSAHRSSNVHFYIWHGEEAFQYEALKYEKCHHGQEYYQRAVEEDHLKGAVVLRVLQNDYMSSK